MIHQKRREELLSMLAHDAVVIVSTNSEQKRNSDVTYPFRPDSNFWYLTGFIEPDAIAIFSKDSYVMFLRPKDETKEIWNGIRLGVEHAPEVLLVNQAYDIDTFFDTMDSFINKSSAIYFDAPRGGGWKDHSSTNIHNNRIHSLLESRLKPLNPFVSEMRLIKDKEEVKNMQDAADLASEAHINAMREATPGLFEHNIASVFDSHFRNSNSEHSYPPIVASGENACILHYTENNQELKNGDLLLIDAGCEINGYASDITRTFPVNGRFSDAQREIYDLVLSAQKSAIHSIEPGVSSNRPHEVACQIITDGLIKLGIMKSPEDLTKFYMHNTGHWLGLDVHDVGSKLVNEEFREFESGMVTTVEPGIYIRRDDKINPRYWGIGVRIEDDVLVTETGNHVLSQKAAKEIDEIEQLMSRQ